MPRPRTLDETLLKKIAEKKRGHSWDSDMSASSNLVFKRATRKLISPAVALILLAKELNIGTGKQQARLSDAERNDLRTSSPPTYRLSSTLTGQSKHPKAQKLRIIEVISYDTDDHFISGHFSELNRAYTFGCYTSVFILARKIVENLIIDILKQYFPEKKKGNKELYFDTAKGRLKDFGVILKNLYSKRNDFGTENKAIERLYKLSDSLKDDANDKTHSWYHLVENRKEIDNLNLVAIFELIKKIERHVGIR